MVLMTPRPSSAIATREMYLPGLTSARHAPVRSKQIGGWMRLELRENASRAFTMDSLISRSPPGAATSRSLLERLKHQVPNAIPAFHNASSGAACSVAFRQPYLDLLSRTTSRSETSVS